MAGQSANDGHLPESPRSLTNIFYEDGGNSSQQRSVGEDELYGRISEVGRALHLDLVILKLEEGIPYQEGAIIALVRGRKQSFDKKPQPDVSNDLGYIVTKNGYFTTSSFHLNASAVAPALRESLLKSLREKKLTPEHYNGHLSPIIYYDEAELPYVKWIKPVYTLDT